MTSTCAKAMHSAEVLVAKLRAPRAELKRRAMGFALAATAALVSASMSLPAQAVLVGDYANRTVIEVYTYPEFGGGDVTFRVNLPIVGCEGGFWIRASDPGFKANVATVLLAYSTKAALRVWAYNDQLWTGSGAPTCRIQGLGLA